MNLFRNLLLSLAAIVMAGIPFVSTAVSAAGTEIQPESVVPAPPPDGKIEAYRNRL